MKKTFFFLLACCLVFLISGCGESTVAAVGKPAPNLDTVNMKGDVWSLSKQKGQVVFVNFWATWCAPCREEMPSMQRLYAKLPKNKFKMVALYNRDKPELVKNFVTKLGITIPILDDQQNILGERYGLTGLPESQTRWRSRSILSQPSSYDADLGRGFGARLARRRMAAIRISSS